MSEINQTAGMKFETVDDLKKFMALLQNELDSIRSMHKENMKIMADYFNFMARALDMAITSGDMERIKKVAETTKENLIMTANDITSPTFEVIR